jgi:hypothetical protein
MKKLALAAAAALAATALTSAAADPAAGDTKVHTKRFVSHLIDDHSTGAHTFASAEAARHAGHIIGYDAVTGHFYPKQERVRVWFSVALKNGTISGVLNFHFNDTVYPGRILNGTGKYKGIEGTVKARPQNDKDTRITLTYHF